MKKTISLFAILLTAFVLTACRGSPSAEEAIQAASEAAEEAEKAAEAAAAAVEAEIQAAAEEGKKSRRSSRRGRRSLFEFSNSTNRKTYTKRLRLEQASLI